MPREKRAYPVDYWAVFSTTQGQLVLEDLQKRFLIYAKGEGLDRVCNALEAQGKQDILNFILSMIDQHELGEEHESESIEV